MEQFDYVIVGGGSSGCVLAARLSEDARNRVLLIEAGPRDIHPFVKIPAAFPRLFLSALDWSYRTEPQPELADRRVYWPRGRVIGGSSSINAMMWVRGFRADYDDWARVAGPGWSYERVLPYFLRAEDTEGATEADSHLGRTGPLAVSRQRDPNPLTLTWLEAAKQAHIDANHEPNGGRDEGAALAMVNQRHGQRHSAAAAYLQPARQRRNLVIWTRARCLGIVFDGRRAVGVDYRRGRQLGRVEANKEVILAAGAVNSPQLLMCSGIGNGRHLQHLGIDVIADVPAVGQHLKDHLTAGIAVTTNERVTLAKAQSIPSLIRYLLSHRGLLTSNIAEGYAFVRSDPRLELPDLELVFAPTLFLNEGLTIPKGHGVTLGAVLLQPNSTGEVTLKSPNPMDPPKIEPRYLRDSGGEDVARLAIGVRRCIEIANSPPLSRLLGDSVQPQGRLDEELVDPAIHRYAQTLYHPVGTCRMGNDANDVVDPALRVRGVERLRVVDASVMPNIPRGHTHAAAVMIAEKAADLISHGHES